MWAPSGCSPQASSLRLGKGSRRGMERNSHRRNLQVQEVPIPVLSSEPWTKSENSGSKFHLSSHSNLLCSPGHSTSLSLSFLICHAKGWVEAGDF